MSRTDVHVPYRVKVTDPGWRAELAAGSRNIHCGCHLCTGAPGRRLRRRQERTAWRSARQALLAVGADYRDEMDSPVIRGKAW